MCIYIYIYVYILVLRDEPGDVLEEEGLRAGLPSALCC